MTLDPLAGISPFLCRECGTLILHCCCLYKNCNFAQWFNQHCTLDHNGLSATWRYFLVSIDTKISISTPSSLNIFCGNDRVEACQQKLDSLNEIVYICGDVYWRSLIHNQSVNIPMTNSLKLHKTSPQVFQCPIWNHVSGVIKSVWNIIVLRISGSCLNAWQKVVKSDCFLRLNQ